MAHANDIGLTGTIQRFQHTHVRVVFEAVASQAERFFGFLSDCVDMGMMSSYDVDSENVTRIRAFKVFSIIKDMAKIGIVKRGVYSDGDFDKSATSSVDGELSNKKF